MLEEEEKKKKKCIRSPGKKPAVFLNWGNEDEKALDSSAERPKTKKSDGPLIVELD